MMQEANRTELNDLGEFGLIDKIKEKVTISNKSTIKGIDDDAAVIKNTEATLVSTDMLMEGIHFNLMYSPLKHLGYKAVVVNISDIYAMNATPKQITVSIALSNRFSIEAVEELYAGIHLACEKYNVDLVGGDTTSSMSGLGISITAIGEAKEEDIVYRNTAKESDLIVVSGDLGGAYMGLQILEREKAVFEENPQIQPDLDGKDYIIERQLKPEARQDIVNLLTKMEVKPTSMIDISDGLASELFHICSQSKLGCSIYEDKLPIDPMTYSEAREFDLDPTMCVLNGGEDYELLFTVSQSDYDKIKGNPHLTVIGHTSDENSGMNLITKNGNSHPLQAQGWNHFTKED